MGISARSCVTSAVIPGKNCKELIMEQEQNKTKKPIFKKWWFWLIIVAVIIVVIAVISGNSDPSKTEVDASTAAGTQNGAVTTVTTKAAAAESFEIGDGVIRVYKNSIGSTWLTVGVPVTNNGTENLYLPSATIDLEDASGGLVKTLELVSAYPEVIAPGETAYYFEETTVEGDIPAAEEMKTILHAKIKKATVDLIRYDLSEVSVKDTQYDDVQVTGRVENTSQEAESFIYVSATLYDADGKFLSVVFTIISDELAPGEKIGFSASTLSSELSASDVGSYDVYAYPQQMQF